MIEASHDFHQLITLFTPLILRTSSVLYRSNNHDVFCVFWIFIFSAVSSNDSAEIISLLV